MLGLMLGQRGRQLPSSRPTPVQWLASPGKWLKDLKVTERPQSKTPRNIHIGLAPCECRAIILEVWQTLIQCCSGCFTGGGGFFDS